MPTQCPNKNANSQFNPAQKNSNKAQNGKKDQKPEGTFPPNMQNMPGLSGFGQNPQGMMMLPPGMQNPNMMQIMQQNGFAASKDKN